MTTALHQISHNPVHPNESLELPEPVLEGLAGSLSAGLDAASLHAAPLHAPAPAPVRVDAIGVEQLAQMAAEVAGSVTRHRHELAAAMQELTALQRSLRSEMRAMVAELDRVAAGVAPGLSPEPEVAVGSSVDPASAVGRARHRRSILSRFRRTS